MIKYKWTLKGELLKDNNYIWYTSVRRNKKMKYVKNLTLPLLPPLSLKTRKKEKKCGYLQSGARAVGEWDVWSLPPLLKTVVNAARCTKQLSASDRLGQSSVTGKIKQWFVHRNRLSLGHALARAVNVEPQSNRALYYAYYKFLCSFICFKTNFD